MAGKHGSYLKSKHSGRQRQGIPRESWAASLAKSGNSGFKWECPAWENEVDSEELAYRPGLSTETPTLAHPHPHTPYMCAYTHTYTITQIRKERLTAHETLESQSFKKKKNNNMCLNPALGPRSVIPASWGADRRTTCLGCRLRQDQTERDCLKIKLYFLQGLCMPFTGREPA